MIGDFILAYRAVKQQKIKEALFRRLIGRDPDYAIIRALINDARVDVVATVTFPNGTKLDLKKADAYDRLQREMLDPERAGSF